MLDPKLETPPAEERTPSLLLASTLARPQEIEHDPH